MKKRGKYFTTRTIFLGLTIFLNITLFMNCSRKSKSSSTDAAVNAASSEDSLFLRLEEAGSLKTRLIAIALTPEFTDETDAFPVSAHDTEFFSIRGQVVKDLQDQSDLIKKLIEVDNIATNDNRVLKEVDMLINTLSKARDILVEYQGLRRDRLLVTNYKSLITQLGESLRNEVAELRADIIKMVEDRISPLETRMTTTESQYAQLKSDFDQFSIHTDQQDLILRDAINSLTQNVDTNINELRTGQSELTTKIATLNVNIGSLQISNANAAAELQKVKELQSQICSVDPETGAPIKTSTCKAISDINCTNLFALDVARTQCNLLIAVLQNHDEQLRALVQVNEKQDQSMEIISTALNTVKDSVAILNDQVTNLTTVAGSLSLAVSLTNIRVNDIGARLTAFDARLAIVEFKANKAEAIAAIESRIKFNDAWIAQRITDISNQYCGLRAGAAFNVYDYESAMFNYAFCKEKLTLLKDAAVINALAASYTKILGSINVDTSCTATLTSTSGGSVSSLTPAQMLQADIANEVLKVCPSGGKEVAWVSMYNLMKYLKTIGPDHRTYASMEKMAKFANILFLGDDWASATTENKLAFENIDPTSDSLKNTPYGQIERLFPYRFVDSFFRTTDSTTQSIVFREDPNSLAADKTAAWSEPFTRSTISLATAGLGTNTAVYMARVRAQEIECNDCGYLPENHKITANGKNRLSYPYDARNEKEFCPIDDRVIVAAGSDSKVYHIFYTYSKNSGVIEHFEPEMVNNNHLTLAHSIADVRNGNFANTGDAILVQRAVGMPDVQVATRWTLNATKPWLTVGPHNGIPRSKCYRFDVNRKLKQDEWIAQGGTAFANYINGFDSTNLENTCKTLPTYATAWNTITHVPTAYEQRSSSETRIASGLSRSWQNASVAGSATKALQDNISNLLTAADDQKQTQLGPNYFLYKGSSGQYGGAQLGVSGIVFYNTAVGSTATTFSSTDLLRASEASVRTNIQECNHCASNIKNPNSTCQVALSE